MMENWLTQVEALERIDELERELAECHDAFADEKQWLENARAELRAWTDVAESCRKELAECREELAEMSTAKADLVGQVDHWLKQFQEERERALLLFEAVGEAVKANWKIGDALADQLYEAWCAYGSHVEEE